MKKPILLVILIILALNIFAQHELSTDSIKKNIANKSIAFTSEYSVIGNGITYDKIFALSAKEKIAISQSFFTSVSFPLTQYGAIPFYGSTAFSLINGFKKSTEVGGYISYGAIINGYASPIADIGLLLGYRYQNPMGGLFFKTGVKFGAISALAFFVTLENYSKADAFLAPLLIAPTFTIGHTFKNKNLENTNSFLQKIATIIEDDEYKRITKCNSFYNKKFLLIPFLQYDNKQIAGRVIPEHAYRDDSPLNPNYSIYKEQNLYEAYSSILGTGLSLMYNWKYKLSSSVKYDKTYVNNSGGGLGAKDYRRNLEINSSISVLPFSLINKTKDNIKLKLIAPEIGLRYVYSEVWINDYFIGNPRFSYISDYNCFQNYFQAFTALSFTPYNRLHISLDIPLNIFAFTNGIVKRHYELFERYPNYIYESIDWTENLKGFYNPAQLYQRKALLHSINLKIGFAI
ncbi:MAG: hypothetical protein ACK4IK_03905 [Bacteroidia bacterium]